MTTYKLIAIELGEGLKYSTTINQIERIATSVFDFGCDQYPHESITSSRSQKIYNWIMTLANQPINEEQKKSLLQNFIFSLTPEGNPLRKLKVNGNKPLELDFWSMIHPCAISIAQKKFEDGLYADAVESAFKEINKRVKEIVKNKTGEELDGADLMNKAFSLKKSIVILDDLSSETGRNIQQGYMQIFAGAMTGIRNPKAHDNITITPERAIHFIFLASLLMYKLDEAKGKRKRRSYVTH